MIEPICPPDLSARPLQTNIVCELVIPPSVVFKAWTEQLDRWLATPGTLLMRPEVNSAFFFETHHGSERQPYYGRFLQLVPDQRIELVWLSTGTKRTETVLTLELTPQGSGTQVKLTHAGFPDEEARLAHEQAWPVFLQKLDEVFGAS